MNLSPLIVCPQCSNTIEIGDRCPRCGGDLSLMVAVCTAADQLARRAARAAAEAQWQDAAALAEESLRHCRRGNDLAALVTLLAALAGAHVSLRTIPRPRPEGLPAALQEATGEAVALIEELRTLAGRAAHRPKNFENNLLRFQRRYPDLPVLSRHPSHRFPSQHPTWSGIAVWLPKLAAAMMASCLLGWWLATVLRRAPSPTPAPATAVASKINSPEVEKQSERLSVLEADLDRQRQLKAVAAAAVDRQWLTALRGLALLESNGEEPAFGPAVRRNGGLEAWRRGRRASRAERFEEAEELLSLAILAPPESYFYNDALYYLARAQHRLGRMEEARATYEWLLRETSGQDYRAEAERFLAQVRRHG